MRALRMLSEVDLILCEDTRVTGKLLAHYKIDTPKSSFHSHNEHRTVEKWVEEMSAGKKLALVSDAGTPGISDPGFLLVRAALENELTVETLPGATAFVPALVNSGLPCDRFCFEGFLPQKKGRQTKLQELAEESRTVVLYESPHRLVKCLTQMIPFFGEERIASVSRELSKLHEENARGTLAELLEHFSAKTVKGEIVLVVEGKKKKK